MCEVSNLSKGYSPLCGNRCHSLKAFKGKSTGLQSGRSSKSPWSCIKNLRFPDWKSSSTRIPDSVLRLFMMWNSLIYFRASSFKLAACSFFVVCGLVLHHNRSYMGSMVWLDFLIASQKLVYEKLVGNYTPLRLKNFMANTVATSQLPAPRDLVM